MHGSERFLPRSFLFMEIGLLYFVAPGKAYWQREVLGAGRIEQNQLRGSHRNKSAERWTPINQLFNMQDDGRVFG